MKAYFSGTRFACLVKAHWIENWRSYAWFAGLVIMIDLIFLVFVFSNESKKYGAFEVTGQIPWFTTGLFCSGIIFATLHFKHLANPGSALIALMRPASHLEKWLLAFGVVSISFPLCYTFLYTALHFPAVQMAKVLYVAPETCKTCTQTALPDFSFYLPFFGMESASTKADLLKPALRSEILTLSYLWTFQALALGGMVFFKVSPVLRSILTYFFLSIILVTIGISPQEGAFWSGAKNEVIPFSAMEYGLSLALWTILPLMLWIALFFHIKERELS